MIQPAERSLLIVEDNDKDFELVQWALKKVAIQATVYRCGDGQEALDFLYHQGSYTDETKAPRPTVVLLDLRLPGIGGQEVLERLKSDEKLKIIPVVVWTSSSEREDIENCLKQGANSYILKPMDIHMLMDVLKCLNQYWFEVALLPEIADTEL